MPYKSSAIVATSIVILVFIAFVFSTEYYKREEQLVLEDMKLDFVGQIDSIYYVDARVSIACLRFIDGYHSPYCPMEGDFFILVSNRDVAEMYFYSGDVQLGDTIIFNSFNNYCFVFRNNNYIRLPICIPSSNHFYERFADYSKLYYECANLSR